MCNPELGGCGLRKEMVPLPHPRKAGSAWSIGMGGAPPREGQGLGPEPSAAKAPKLADRNAQTNSVQPLGHTVQSDESRKADG